jgi:hypothetical protein
MLSPVLKKQVSGRNMTVFAYKGGKIRDRGSTKIEASPKNCPSSKREQPLIEKVNLFPECDGFLYQGRQVTFIPGWDPESRSGQAWDAETLRDYYLAFNDSLQSLFLVKSGLSKYHFGLARFWDSLTAFVRADQIYVVEREKIGVFPFNPRRILQISVSGTVREYPIPGLRDCRLVTSQEAKYMSCRILASF